MTFNFCYFTFNKVGFWFLNLFILTFLEVMQEMYDFYTNKKVHNNYIQVT